MVNIGVMLLYPKSVRILSVKLSLQNQIFTDQSHVSGELVVFCPYLVNSKFLLICIQCPNWQQELISNPAVVHYCLCTSLMWL